MSETTLFSNSADSCRMAPPTAKSHWTKILYFSREVSLHCVIATLFIFEHLWLCWSKHAFYTWHEYKLKPFLHQFCVQRSKSFQMEVLSFDLQKRDFFLSTKKKTDESLLCVIRLFKLPVSVSAPAQWSLADGSNFFASLSRVSLNGVS